MISCRNGVAFAFICISFTVLTVSTLLNIPALSQTNSGKNNISVWPKYVPKWGKVVQEQKGRTYWTERGNEAKVLTDQRWAQEQWTGDDKPYATIRTQIESLVDAGHQPLTLASQYASTAKKEPNNSLAQFAWAYAVHLALASTPASETMSNLRFSAELALAKAPMPHAYNYNRLHYLLWIQSGGASAGYFLRNLSARLLKKDPQDFPVLVGQALIYTQYKGKPEQSHGYELIQSILKKYPDRPEVYDTLGCWYYTQYMYYHNSDNYQKSMNYYRQALKMYPLTSDRQSKIQEIMSTLTMRYNIYRGG